MKMKKNSKLFIVLLALVVMATMTACGGNDKDSSDAEDVDTGEEVATTDEDTESDEPEFPFITATIPDGWEFNEERSTSYQIYIDNTDGSGQLIQLNASNGTAQASLDKSLGMFESNTRGDDLTIGDYTYMTELFEWNKKPSITLYLDQATKQGDMVKINFFEIAPGDPIIEEFMLTVTYI